jgi:hypothetical protein
MVRLVPWLRRLVGIRSWGRVALMDAAVCVGTISGFIAGS